jgi:hypothetical protein
MHFDEALKAHNMLKIRLILDVNNPHYKDTADLYHAHQCALDHWLTTAREREPSCDILAEMETIHKAFHACATEFAALLQQNHKKEAKALLKPEGSLSQLANRFAEVTLAYKRKQQDAA